VTAFLLCSGAALLFVGGELLVRGAVRLALAMGTTRLIIGLTVVAFGTSAPELAVSVLAGVRGNSDLAVGNVVGSNIFNVLFILGVSSFLVPLVVSRQVIRLDVPVMIGVSMLLLVFAFDRTLTPAESVVLVALLAVYVAVQIYVSRGATPVRVPGADVIAPDLTATPYTGRWYLEVGLIAIGLAVLFVGSQWLIDGAVMIAQQLGASELVIGLTLVAAGTSLPEVATSVIAAVRGERDIAVGNIIGSNIFNILAVLGITGMVSPGGVAISPAVLSTDIPIMLAVAVVCFPIFFTGYTMTRGEGLLFLAYYALYITYLVLDGSEHHGLPQFRHIVLNIVLPVTVAPLPALMLRSWLLRRRPPE
jgi:cation:H+ antiporter